MGLPPKCGESWYLCEHPALADGAQLNAFAVLELERQRFLAVDAGPGALKTALRKACSEPLEGKPRRPALLQVERQEHLDALRGVMPGVALALAPRPSMAKALEALDQQANRTNAGADGLEAMARAGVRFAAAAPWELLDDEAIVVEAPEHGLERGALIAMGQNGQHFGFLLFSSPGDAEIHREFSTRGNFGARPRSQPVDYLVFELERTRDLDPMLRRALEALVGKQKLLAVASRATRDLRFELADQREMRLLAAVAEALAAMMREEGSDGAQVFEHAGVTLHVPRAEVEEPLVFGVDYFDLADEAPDDLRLLGRIARWCDEHLGPEYEDEFVMTFSRRQSSPAGAGLWMWPRLLLAEAEGRSFVAHFRAAGELTATEEALLAAQGAAWNGLWERREETSEARVALVDLLTEARREVPREEISDRLSFGSILCARIMEIDGGSHVTSRDPVALSPGPIDGLLKTLRAELAWPSSGPVTRDQVHTLEAQLAVADIWNELIEELADALVEPRDIPQ